MKRFLLFLLTFSLGYALMAQDLVITREGDSIWGKVKVVTADSIGILNGGEPASMQMYHKHALSRLEYANGVQVSFNEALRPVAGDSLLSLLPAYDHGSKDAEMFYKGYRTAGTATLISSLFFPLFGLIPAVSCAYSPPQTQNLNIPPNAPISDSNYVKGYQDQAKAIKKKKVWKNYAIGAGVSLGLRVVYTVVIISVLSSL